MCMPEAERAHKAEPTRPTAAECTPCGSPQGCNRFQIVSSGDIETGCRSELVIVNQKVRHCTARHKNDTESFASDASVARY